MSQQLINHSSDLKRLRDEGYEVEVKGGYLFIHHIPYVNSRCAVEFGTLVTVLNLLSNTQTTRPNDHIMHFIGEHPCDKDGKIIAAISYIPTPHSPAPGIEVNCSFSNKPAEGYSDYYHKVSRYADVISAPAKSMDLTVTEKTFIVVESIEEFTPFQYVDTNSSRANILNINQRFNGQKVAIVGLGGTGAYILDQVAKTPCAEIHILDGDDFLQHNAFRSPGAASTQQLNRKLQKVDYYHEIYSNMHKHIIPHDCYLTSENLNLLNEMSYIFICIDKNGIRKLLMDHLIMMQIPFIDVGLGVNIVGEKLIGMTRVTSATAQKNDHLLLRIPCGEEDDNNEYRTNIQIADLNALNAMHAVIKWKKMSGFYQDLELEHHSTYSINVAQLTNEDLTA
ncbi:ThiF family adenylyltransferase [Pedobacter gandavensis]|uniref:ThiF family adenylyltransferase n=1 Tax=Pedobacter gandavensis TaxID=2679963 RepID=UPI00292E779D|nr:ThiF family adenylyltransferase [Pedobacter gandavensis]